MVCFKRVRGIFGVDTVGWDVVEEVLKQHHFGDPDSMVIVWVLFFCDFLVPGGYHMYSFRFCWCFSEFVRVR